MLFKHPFIKPFTMESGEKSSMIFPSRGLMLIGIRFYPCDEGDEMSRRAAQCIQKSLFGSKDWFYFNKGFKVIEDENGVITSVDVQSDTFDSSFFLFSEPHKVNISVSAIVGQSGTGKSTIVDNVIHILNNLSAAIIGEDFVYTSAQHLHYIDNVYASLAVYQESCIKFVTCKGRKLEVAEFCVELNDVQLKRYDNEDVFTEHYKLQSHQIVLDGSSNSNDVLQPQEGLKSILGNWFYTLVGNYSLYAYNYRDYQYEWSSEDKISKLKREDDKESDYERYCWLKGGFHKNDGYQTPIVIHPMSAITPFLFNYLFTNDRSVKSVVKRAIFVTLVVTFIIELIRFTAPSYFSALEIGLTQMPAYILGLFGGYLAVKGYKSYWVIPALAFFFIILLVLSHVFPAIESYKLIMLRLLCMCLICNILQCIINKMGGGYGHSDGWAHIRLNCI